MRRAAALLATLALLALPTTVLAQEEFSAELDADQEVPAPTVPDPYEGSGSATVTISDDETEIDVHVEWSGLTGDAVGAHIHYGPTGQAGGIIFPLDHSAGSPIDQTLTEADFTPADDGPQTYAEALAAIRDGNAYINVHTEANQPGEIRGQLMGDDDGEPELPDSSTAPVDALPGTPPLSPVGLLLALASAAALAFGLHRFSPKRI